MYIYTLNNPFLVRIEDMPPKEIADGTYPGLNTNIMRKKRNNVFSSKNLQDIDFKWLISHLWDYHPVIKHRNGKWTIDR